MPVSAVTNWVSWVGDHSIFLKATLFSAQTYPIHHQLQKFPSTCHLLFIPTALVLVTSHLDCSHSRLWLLIPVSSSHSWLNSFFLRSKYELLLHATAKKQTTSLASFSRRKVNILYLVSKGHYTLVLTKYFFVNNTLNFSHTLISYHSSSTVSPVTGPLLLPSQSFQPPCPVPHCLLPLSHRLQGWTCPTFTQVVGSFLFCAFMVFTTLWYSYLFN